MDQAEILSDSTCLGLFMSPMSTGWRMDGVYYMLPNGGWIPGKGSRIGEYSRFQGLQFDRTPANSFAWPLPFYTDKIPVHTAPGFNAPLTDRILYPYVNIVQVYDTQNGRWRGMEHDRS